MDKSLLKKRTIFIFCQILLNLMYRLDAIFCGLSHCTFISISACCDETCLVKLQYCENLRPQCRQEKRASVLHSNLMCLARFPRCLYIFPQSLQG